MQRYFIKNKINNIVELEQSDLHHIKKVMRMLIGDRIECVFENKLYLCEIKSLDPVNIEIVEELEIEESNKPTITICIPLLVEQKMDFILQKCTELGVNEIYLFDASRSKIKFDEEKLNKKIERWTRICKEASEQSHRIDIPKISGVYKIKDLLKYNGLKLVCSTSTCQSIKKVLKKAYNYDRIIIVVGPEGGISDKEENEFLSVGFERISLGPNILRAETAPICALSIINYEFME